jgi:hypothetical protein
MWNAKAKVILVIKGANGTISKSLTQHVSNIARKNEIKEIQKISAIWGCAHKLREELIYVAVRNIFLRAK